MTETVILLTGGTSGVGRAAAPRLAADGATVVITGRDRAAGEAVAEEIAAAHADAEGRFIRVDFAEFDAVRDLARTIRRDYDRLDALVNNAGLACDDRILTPDGVERTFAVNHLAPFLLSACLAPRLRESAPSRVVTTSSEVHRQGDLSDLEAVIEGRNYDGWQAYADSKLANVLFTWELAERFADEGVAAAAFHPGWVPTSGLWREAGTPARLVTAAAGAVARVAAVGPIETETSAGRAQADLVTDWELEPGSPVYVDRRRPADPAPAATDDELRERLWERSAELVDVSPSVPDGDPLG